MTNNARLLFLALSCRSRITRSQKLELKFDVSSEFSEFFDKIPVRILLDVLLYYFVCFGFLKEASFNALTSSSPSWN